MLSACSRRRAAVALGAVLALHRLAVPHAAADVFARIPRQPGAVIERAGGRRLRSTPVTVNGRAGRLTMFGFEQPVIQVAGVLGRMLERPGLAQAAAGGALWFEWPGSTAQGLLVSAGGADATLFLLLDVPPSGIASAALWPWADLPPPADFTPGFSAELDEPSSALVTGTAARTPGATRRALGTHLAGHGWTPAAPAAELLATALYVRGREVLAVTVLAAEDRAAGSRILLHRRAPR